MSAPDLVAILPLLVLSLGAVTLMLQIAFRRDPAWSWSLTLITLVTTALACLAGQDYGEVSMLMIADDYSQVFSLVFVGSATLISLLAKDYLADTVDQEEFCLLLLLATLGAVVLCYASHLATLLLGMELMGVALYTLIAYPDSGKLPLEAAIKYLVLSGAASATLLFGFGLLYAATGSLEFSEVGRRISSSAQSGNTVVLVAAGVFIISGLAFKLSVVPFHMWTPDVYEGAPAPVAAFLGTVSKAAVFVALLRWLLEAGYYNYPTLISGLSILAMASMLAGNLLALQQQNIKRLLAYSSVAHFGYILIFVVAAAHSSDHRLLVEASGYYLMAYMAATLAVFALIGILPSRGESHECDQISDLEGLFWRHPLPALLMAIALLSLAGIPLTAGFIGKFYLIQAGIDATLWGLLAALVVGSGIAVFYYLRIVFVMSKSCTEDGTYVKGEISGAGGFAMYVLIYLILYLGIFPQPLMAYLQAIY